MADEHTPTREIVDLAPPITDPLIAFYWSRLDEHERLIRDATEAQPFLKDLPSPRFLDDLAAKKAILDDYARYCADIDNPAREMICQVSRDVIKRLATVYAGHPDYDEAWRP